MIKWVNFLHIYQPPHQTKEIIRQVSKQSYSYIIKTLKKHPKAKLTLNISGCLTDLLLQYNQQKILEGFKDLVKNGQIELVATAKYHPILPLLPEPEIKHQIEINQTVNKAYFGTFQPKGFYLPEMAYSKRVAKIIAKLGYKWIILDEISYNGKLGEVDFNKKYKIKDLNLFVVFRKRDFSKTFPPTTIIKLAEQKEHPKYAITATDGEMYGYYHKDDWKAFAHSLKMKNVETLKISELLSNYKKVEVIDPVESNWESKEKELKNNIPYSLWNDPKNKIHQLLRALRKMSIELIDKHKKDPNYSWARRHLDRGLSSCTWWWASGKKPDIFSPFTWNPDEIEKGLKELISSIRSLQKIPIEQKLKAEKLYLKLVGEIWRKHWLAKK